VYGRVPGVGADYCGQLQFHHAVYLREREAMNARAELKLKAAYSPAQIRKVLRGVRDAIEHSLDLHLKEQGEKVVPSFSCSVCQEWCAKRDTVNELIAVFGGKP
jgi:hypothetical protein